MDWLIEGDPPWENLSNLAQLPAAVNVMIVVILLAVLLPTVGLQGLVPACCAMEGSARSSGVAPLIDLSATHISTLEFVDEEDLRDHAIATSE